MLRIDVAGKQLMKNPPSTLSKVSGLRIGRLHPSTNHACSPEADEKLDCKEGKVVTDVVYNTARRSENWPIVKTLSGHL